MRQINQKVQLILDIISENNQLQQLVEYYIADMEGRFNALTSEQQGDSEVIDARKGEVSLRLKIDDIDNVMWLHKQEFMPHGINNAGFHNCIYRGKNLGNEVTQEQYNNIDNGSFEDMYVGDYWTRNSKNFRIAAFNYHYNTGDTALTKNHITLIPDTNLYTHKMNTDNTTVGGYTGSLMYTDGLDSAKDIINAAFPDHVLKHRAYLSNAVTNGNASAGTWVDSEIELMNEIMVYGSIINGHATYGLHNIGVHKTQLPLFALRPDFANIRTSYWLRDVSSASYFAFVSSSGYAYYNYASVAYGVRPAFSIYKS